MEIIRVFHQDAKAISSLYATSWKAAYKDILPHAYLNNLSNERWLPMFEDSTIACFALKEHGSHMLSFAIRYFQEEGLENIYLWVLQENRKARSFYEKHGFIANGELSCINIAGTKLIETKYCNTTKNDLS